MSIPTIELATAIHTALRALTWPDGFAVYARGVPTNQDGAPNPEAVENKKSYPFVDVIVSERVPSGYRSILRAYPLVLRVVTYQPQDQFQVAMYTGGNAMGDWISTGPTLSGLTTVVFDSIFFSDAPTMGNFSTPGSDNQFGQYIEWTATINTRVTA
jgi:hypothetical protein